VTISDRTVAIIGTGTIGGTIATNFAAGGQDFLLAGREQDAGRKLAADLDGHAQAVSVAEAVDRADVLVLAVWLDVGKQLIAEYDQPAPADSVKTRRTAAIKIRYSKASTIATALKDVYRDLLSSRDREFDKGDKRQQSAQQERVTVIEYGQPSSDGSSKRPSPVKIGFEGALSVGVDDISNMLIVSVQEELFDSVVGLNF